MKKEMKLKPQGIFLKMDWAEMFNDLDDASVGKLIKNSYNYLNQIESLKMDKMESMLFKHTILPVLEYNLEKYNLKVEHNRSIAKKGGRKSKKAENPLGFLETHNNPDVASENPENPKDINRARDKVIGSKKDIEINISKVKSDIEKMRKLIEMNLVEIKEDEHKNFGIMVKELERILGWTRLKLLIFYAADNDVESLLSEYGKLECLRGVKSTRSLYQDYLDKILQ